MKKVDIDKLIAKVPLGDPMTPEGRECLRIAALLAIADGLYDIADRIEPAFKE